MRNGSDIDESRRDLLIRLLAAGAFAISGSRANAAKVLGTGPVVLPAGRSVHSVVGDVRVNGRAIDRGTLIYARDVIETGASGKLVFVMGRDAFLLRADSRLEMAAAGAEEFAVAVLRLVSGSLLSVFGKSAHEIHTATATIGIRGTGVYVEADPEQTYVCTCYGTTEVAASDAPEIKEVITSAHHDAPRYVLGPNTGSERIKAAPFKNHTDQELELIESLVGRSTPYELPGDAYGRPRRNTY